MLAEVLLVLAGHSSSLFPTDHSLHPSFKPLLHPGEQQCLESLAEIAFRYRKIKKLSSDLLERSQSRYICALCATLNKILQDEYESLVVETEARVLKRDPALVASGSFVPLSTIKATFSKWDAPLLNLENLLEEIGREVNLQPGPLIDMLLTRAHTGIHLVSEILTRLSVAVQCVWRARLIAFLIHGTTSEVDPIASDKYVILEGSMPSCVSAQSRDSIAYIGRAVGTIKAANWKQQLPRDLTSRHADLVESVLPEDQNAFDLVIRQIRIDISEWIWLHVLTRKDVEDAVDSLANYFLLRNGEFSVSLVREIEQLKLSRLTTRTGAISLIREQDLNLALLRASLNTSAQHDPALTRLRFRLPSGPIRPLLPSLISRTDDPLSGIAVTAETTSFDDILLGTPSVLTYSLSWPLDLFLHDSDLRMYATIFSYVSALRRAQTRIHDCWTTLSNSQRARRRWTGLGEGGTKADLGVREALLRCGWGVVRDMGWFVDTVVAYVMTDVIDVEFRRLKGLLDAPTTSSEGEKSVPIHRSEANVGSRVEVPTHAKHLDFTTLRNMHNTYLERLLTGCLISNPTLTAILRPILEVCDSFVAQVERWGGDILPALLFEGSLAGGQDSVGELVKERRAVVAEINDTLRSLFDAFYEQLSASTSQRPFSATTDASKSILMNASVANASTFARSSIGPRGAQGLEGDGEVRRHVERLLLRLDFSGGFSNTKRERYSQDILKQGGLA